MKKLVVAAQKYTAKLVGRAFARPKTAWVAGVAPSVFLFLSKISSPSLTHPFSGPEGPIYELGLRLFYLKYLAES